MTLTGHSGEVRCLHLEVRIAIVIEDITSLGTLVCLHSALRLKSIRPFAHLSYKFEIFDWSKMGVKMIEKSPILQKMLIYVGYHSSRNLDPIFSVVLKIRAFEVVSF